MALSKSVLDVAIAVALFITLEVVYDRTEPFKTGFWCKDNSIRHPYRPDTVSETALFLVGWGGTVLVMCVTEAVRQVARSRRLASDISPFAELLSLGKATGLFFFGVVVTFILTDVLQLSVGRLRPHFISVCRPNVNCLEDDHGLDVYITDYKCTNTEASKNLLRKSTLSFPSGHASVSVYNALFLIFYLQLRMETSHLSTLLRPTLQLVPLLLAILCCVSRVTDNKKFPSDVLAGVVLGAVVAWLVFYKLADSLIPSQIDHLTEVNTSQDQDQDYGVPTTRTLPTTTTDRETIRQFDEEGSSFSFEKSDHRNSIP